MKASSASAHVSAPSSCSASDRRALKISVSSARSERPMIPAISAYERPSNSRITSASRCEGGMCRSARRTSATPWSLRSGAAGASCSSNSTSLHFFCVSRKWRRTSLCAIVSSQFSALRGFVPWAIAR